MINAKVILDSVAENGSRLTTMELEYPRFIHAEFMTHRAFSRNSASSRAIPVERFLNRVTTDPAMPIHYGANQKGMSADEELSYEDKLKCIYKIKGLMGEAVWVVKQLSNLGLHKQVANRYLEPWFHIKVICSATEWTNFFLLRCYKAAMPEMQALADAMLKAYVTSFPVKRTLHCPYAPEAWPTEEERIKISVARCARVSYLTHDGNKPTVESDMLLYDRLLEQQHLSPFEHVAFAAENKYDSSGNFYGWRQYRENVIIRQAVDLNELAKYRGLI